MFGRQRQPAEVRPLERGCDQRVVRFRWVASIALCISAWMLLSAASLRSDELPSEPSGRTSIDRVTQSTSSSTSVSRSSAARRSNVWRARPATPERPLLDRSKIENPPPERQARRSSQAHVAPAATKKTSVVQTAGWKGTSNTAEFKQANSQSKSSKGTQVTYRPSQPPNQLNLD